MRRQAYTLAIRAAIKDDDDDDSQQEGQRHFPYLMAGIQHASLDGVYSLLRQCPDALGRYAVAINKPSRTA